MTKLTDQTDENQSREAGMFYPKGFIVAGFDVETQAQKLRDALHQLGFAANEVTFVSAADMAQQAGENLENPSVFSGMGSTLAIREKQFDLAKQGCSFLLIKAPEDEQEKTALQAFAGVPVRYAVKYRMLVIENMLPLISSATPDPEPARISGSSR